MSNDLALPGALTRPGIPSITVPILALACAITVSNVYFCQPLLHEIGQSMGVPDRAAALVATAAQIGYACGIALVVPLADAANLRRLAAILVSFTALACFAGAVAPSVGLLALATGALATTTVMPQIVMPIASSLAAPGRSGAVVAIVSTGLSLGAVMSRTLSGAVAGLAGNWRASYVVAGLFTGALLWVLPRFMPQRPAPAPGGGHLGYGALLRSLPRLFLQHPEVRLAAFLGCMMFASFTSFWATLVFHLAHAPFGLGAVQAGLFGLWGAPGTLGAALAGRLTDRRGPTIVNAFAIASSLCGYALLAAFGPTSFAALVVGCNLLCLGSSSAQIANQSRIFALGPDTRARVNTLYMFSSFAGGALGTQVGVALYTSHGWRGMCAGAFGFIAMAALGLAAWSITRSRERSP
jgi:predicted MFS family arabinose efflux permease